MKIAFIMGVRPEFVQAEPVINNLKKHDVIEDVFIKEENDSVIVFGDTNTTLAGALAAAKLHIPIVHVEAVLRCFDWRMPEEINRVAVDHVSNMLFAPANTAVTNLSKEGISECVCNTSDVMFDSLLQKTDSIKNNREILDEYNLQAQNYFLMTLHRSETTERFENLKNILLAIKESGKQFAWLS